MAPTTNQPTTRGIWGAVWFPFDFDVQLSSTAANSWHWIFWNFRIKAGTLNSQFLNFAIVDGFDLKLGFIGFGTICRFFQPQ